MLQNDWRESTKNRSGVVAVTVAVRGMSTISAISPKKSPSPIVRRCWPSFVASAVALDDHEELLRQLALAAEHAARFDLEILGRLRELCELVLGQIAEERRAAERLDLGVM